MCLLILRNKKLLQPKQNCLHLTLNLRLFSSIYLCLGRKKIWCVQDHSSSSWAIGEIYCRKLGLEYCNEGVFSIYMFQTPDLSTTVQSRLVPPNWYGACCAENSALSFFSAALWISWRKQQNVYNFQWQFLLLLSPSPSSLFFVCWLLTPENVKK